MGCLNVREWRRRCLANLFARVPFDIVNEYLALSFGECRGAVYRSALGLWEGRTIVSVEAQGLMHV